MLGASKILTVSYGTFSCTLEGFDEPFNTMKAIAEYFRDLAAEDRYFGAEPPTPDAAMLHKIAEREIQRRVEAKIQDNGVILRADNAQTPISAPPPLAAPPAPALAELALQDGTGESLSARLSRLRANQNAEEPQIEAAGEPEAEPQAMTSDLPPAPDPAPTPDPVSESQPKAPPVQGLAQTSTLLDDDYTEDQHAGEMGPDILARVEALTAKALPEAQADLVAEPAPAPAAVGEPVADLSTPAQTAEDDAAETEALLAQLRTQTLDLPAVAEVTPPPAVTAALPEPDAITASPTLDLPAAPVEAAGALASDAEADTDALLANLALQIEPADLAAETAPPETAAAIDQAALASESQAPEAPIEATAPPEPAPLRPQTAEEALAEALGIDAPEARAMIDKPEAAPLPEAAAQDITRARVIRVRRIEPTPPQPPRDSVLSQDAEAALMSELAALQSPDPAAADTAPTEAVRPTRPVRVLRPDPNSATPKILVQTVSGAEAADLRQGLTDLSKDDAVNRLIAQTNSALDGPEARRRSAAISHLKAAVAATEAERQLQDGSPAPQDDRKSVYRDDLDSVVRPNPAASRAAERPGPLVLVSEQRIDRAKPAPTPLTAGRVMPTRLVPAGLRTASPEGLIGGDLDDEDDDALLTAEEASANLFTEGTSFADFAEQLGAESLHDLLEASAVYCAQILGRPQFSRPLVMSQINTLPNAEKHRLEDQLRAFGTLMREGRIKKIKRGGFAVTDRSPLLAEALRNAG